MARAKISLEDSVDAEILWYILNFADAVVG